MDQTASPETELDVSKPPIANAMQSDQEPTSSPYGSWFGELPEEIRIQVWTYVLKSAKKVINVHKFMSPQEPLMVAACPPNKDIDAALLRTCSAIYEEAFPILYRENSFVFSAPSEITVFAFGKLHFPSRRHCSSHLLGPSLKQNVHLAGRLALLRSMTLVLNNPEPLSRNQERHRTPVLEAAWSAWRELFQTSSRQPSLTFPVLEELCLFFPNWRLDNSDASKLRVEPLLRKLRPPGGLRYLYISGIKHEQNLNDLKYGFLRKGGCFLVSDSKTGGILAQEIVSHDNLHTVSKGVRDILQRNGVSAVY